MKEEISLLIRCFRSAVTRSHHGILWWVGVGLTQLVRIKRRIETEFFRPSLWIYLVCLRYFLQNVEAFLLNHVTTAPVFPSVSPLFFLLLSPWRVFPISFVCPPPTFTCSISRMCDNRSGVNVNSQTYIISSLHNFTEAHTLTDRQTRSDGCPTLLLRRLCLLCAAAGTWSLNWMQKMMLQTSRQSGAFTDTESTAWFALTDHPFPGTFVLTCVRTYELLRCRFHRNSNTAFFLGFV